MSLESVLSRSPLHRSGRPVVFSLVQHLDHLEEEQDIRAYVVEGGVRREIPVEVLRPVDAWITYNFSTEQVGGIQVEMERDTRKMA